MGPGNSLMRDILWGLDPAQAETQQVRVFGDVATSKVAPAHEKPVLLNLPTQHASIPEI